jgi:hypothetical protein
LRNGKKKVSLLVFPLSQLSLFSHVVLFSMGLLAKQMKMIESHESIVTRGC